MLLKNKNNISKYKFLYKKNVEKNLISFKLAILEKLEI